MDDELPDRKTKRHKNILVKENMHAKGSNNGLKISLNGRKTRKYSYLKSKEPEIVTIEHLKSIGAIPVPGYKQIHTRDGIKFYKEYMTEKGCVMVEV
jgi:hypothetical protein